jgi:NADH-quinone oxidoreductase subunit M
MSHYLSIVLFTPLAGALLLLLVPRQNENAIRWIANLVALIGFGISVPLWFWYSPEGATFQFVERAPWIPSVGADYFIGVDGLSTLLILLTTMMGFIAVLSSWTAITERVKEYYIFLLVLQTGMLGAFMSLDFLLFFLFWEVMLVPMYFLIGIWGSANRLYSAIKFFLYTLVGSVVMLLGILALYFAYHADPANGGVYTFDITRYHKYVFAESLQWWVFLAFFLGFAIKVPMFPFHTWLPDAHTDAPTAGSVILAAILLKLGGYGFLRFSLPMFPDASQALAPLIYAMSIIAIIYTSLVALMQEDMKKLIAYSSVAHMGFVTMGIFAMTAQGVAGGIFQMISHGIVSAALFLCVGVVYDRMHTREIAAYGGLVNRMPIYAFAFMVFTLANVGLPGTSGFVGEFLTLIGTFRVNTWVATLATLGIILSAAYALWLYRKVIFGKLEKPSLFNIKDIGWREMVVLAPLVVLTIVFGIYPKPVLDLSAASVAQLMDNYQHALEPIKAAMAR